jgi:hypothetical protein
MLARAGKCLGLLLVFLLPLSCTRLARFVPEAEGGVPAAPLKDLRSVPLEWGNLVSVTSVTTGTSPEQLQYLWFQDKEGNVRVVIFDLRTNQFRSIAGLFRRN